MLKRIVLGIALAALIGFLVLGGIIRTAAKTGDGSHGEGTGEGARTVEWLEIEGTVMSADADALTVEIDEGQEVVVEGRAWLFAQEWGFSPRSGDKVTLLGFYEDDPFADTGQRYEVGQINNSTTGEVVQIREQSGRPLWAGRNRRGG